ncbi:MAG: Ribonuclease E [Lentisphaerae bacterium ADurb.BinA184]|nr:MAG: Ribonuclease E [Lentisphaerae bacterium ADurb.BinA184]
MLGLLGRRLFGRAEAAATAPAPRPPPPAARPARHRQPPRRGPSLTVEEIPTRFPPQTEILVQVTKGPIGNKGSRVTANLSIPGRFLVLLPNSSHVGVSKRIEDRHERERIRQMLRGLRVPRGMGLICRTLGEGKQEPEFREDFELLMGYWQRLEKTRREKRAPCCVYQEPPLFERMLRDYLYEDVEEVVVDSERAREVAAAMVEGTGRRTRVRLYKGAVPLFDHSGIQTEIDNILTRQVRLPGGGYLCVDETEALIAIDVNTGRNRTGKDHPETILKTNLEAVAEIARQLRVRNIGGQIVLDLIDMRSREDRQTVFKAFKDALRRDRAHTKVCPISPLGLIEMTRQREHGSLLETVYSPCPYCRGKGRVKSPKSVSVEIQRRLQSILRGGRSQQLRVSLHPHVLERLRNEDADLLEAMERNHRGELSFRADPELHLEEFTVTDAATGRRL